MNDLERLLDPLILVDETRKQIQGITGFKGAIAIIGFGKMGILHSGILNLLVPGSVKYIVDKSLLISLGGRLFVKTLRFYRSFEKLLSKEDVDAVYVTTPTSSHYPIVKRALEAGIKGVFVEKPPTVNSKQLLELIDLSRKSIVTVGFQKRYGLPFIHAKKIIDSKALGLVKQVACYIKSGDILTSTDRFDALGRGVLLDLGVHLVDLLTWFFSDLEVVKAEYKSLYTKVDDVFKAELESSMGFKVFFETTWSDSNYRLPETYMKIEMENGIVEVTEDYLKVACGNSSRALYKPNYYQGFPPVNLADPEYTIENMFFLSSLVTGVKPPSDLCSTLKTMELIDKLYERGKHG